MRERIQADQAVIFPFDEKDCEATFSKALGRISGWVDTYPFQFIGFGRVNLGQPEEALQDLQECVYLDLRGIKVHPRWQEFSWEDPHILKVMTHAAVLGLPIIFHTDQDVLLDLESLLIRTQRSANPPSVVLGHSGMNFGVGKAISLARKLPNVYLEVSITPTRIVKKILRFVDPSKIIFGSDLPYGDLDTVAEVRELIKNRSSFSARQKMLGGNISRICDQGARLEGLVRQHAERVREKSFLGVCISKTIEDPLSALLKSIHRMRLSKKRGYYFFDLEGTSRYTNIIQLDGRYENATVSVFVRRYDNKVIIISPGMQCRKTFTNEPDELSIPGRISENIIVLHPSMIPCNLRADLTPTWPDDSRKDDYRAAAWKVSSAIEGEASELTIVGENTEGF